MEESLARAQMRKNEIGELMRLIVSVNLIFSLEIKLRTIDRKINKDQIQKFTDEKTARMESFTRDFMEKWNRRYKILNINCEF